MAAAKKTAKSKSRKPRKKPTSGRSSSATRGSKSIEEFRDQLERSLSMSREQLTLSRDRIQEVVDDAVKRGRMTPKDGKEMVSRLVTRGRKQTDELIAELENLLDHARKQIESGVSEVESRVAPARKRVEKVAKRAEKRARSAADPALAEADKLRRRAGVGGGPITGYENLNASQVKARLKDMKKADLRKVRTQEKRGKARKGILDEIERRLAS
ncbi:hypothetical protein BH24ACT23_BH24ACT23_05210 [soil metagenome]